MLDIGLSQSVYIDEEELVKSQLKDSVVENSEEEEKALQVNVNGKPFDIVLS